MSPRIFTRLPRPARAGAQLMELLVPQQSFRALKQASSKATGGHYGLSMWEGMAFSINCSSRSQHGN